MSEPTLLMLLSVALAVVLLLALALLAGRIADELEAIGSRESMDGAGGGMSLLAKIAMGVRAIETETSHLGPRTHALNEKLERVAGGLTALHDQVSAIAAAVDKQEG